MDLYPSIDVRGGRCVRLYQGDYGREIVYGDDPVAVARGFAGAGAPWIHVVDLDAARGQGDNRDLVLAVARAVDVPVQAGGGVRDGSLLDAGVARVVLGSLAMAEPDRAAALIESYPGRVVIGLDHRDGEVRVRGWEAGSGVSLHDALRWPQFGGAAAFVVTNIAHDATMQGPDLDGLAGVLAVTETPVVASGGVGTVEHLEALAALEAGGRRLAGAIVGRAIYEGTVDVAAALARLTPH